METKRPTVLVCGGRDFADHKAVTDTLNGLQPKLIVQGGAKGADHLAGLWCMRTATPCRIYPANWAEFGKRAGIMRNQEMLDKEDIDIVVAFPGGKGTADMVRRAKKAGVQVLEVKP